MIFLKTSIHAIHSTETNPEVRCGSPSTSYTTVLKTVASSIVEEFDDEEEDTLRDAYMQIFDLVDADGSGTLDENEMKQWLEMCGAELDLKTILDVLLKDGNLSRQKFGKLMSSFTSDSRRDYDIGGKIKSSH